MRLLLSTTMIAVLAGCATAQLSNDVKPYVGRDIHELAARMGKPRGERETSGSRVFVWSSTTDGDLPTSAVEGVHTRPITEHFECTIEATVSAQDIIQDVVIEGSNAGCHALRRRISR